MTAFASASGYSITDLGMGGASSASPMCINNAGQAVANFGGNSYFYSGGTLTAVPGITGSVAVNAMALGEDGTVVGSTTLSNGAYRPFKSLGGTTTALQVLEGDPGLYASANAINASGTIVGRTNQYTPHLFFDQPVTWSGSTITQQLPKLNFVDSGSANGINSSGVVVGNIDSAMYPNQVGAIWTNGHLATVPYFGGDYTDSRALGILDDGTVLVSQYAFFGDGSTRATLLKNGSYTDLGDLGGGSAYANGMNNLGTVVGTSLLANSSMASFLWTSTSGMINLSAQVVGSTYSSFSAYDVNDSGQIIGLAQLAGSGVYRSIILTPQAVPEPASLAALGLGAVALLRRRRKV